MIVGDDILDPAHAAGLQTFQESTPVYLRLGQGDGDAENAATLVQADPDG